MGFLILQLDVEIFKHTEKRTDAFVLLIYLRIIYCLINIWNKLIRNI